MVAIATRLIRAPFVVLSLVAGTFMLFAYLSAITLGEWLEQFLLSVNLNRGQYWLPGFFGFVACVVLVIAGPAFVGFKVVGWPGIGLGPACAVYIISVLGRW